MLLVSFLYAWRLRVLVCRRDTHTCAYISGGQRRKSRVFLYPSPPYSERKSSNEPEVHHFSENTELAGKIPVSKCLSSNIGIADMHGQSCLYMGTSNLDYGAPVFTASKLICWTISPALFFFLNNYPSPPPAWFVILMILKLCSKPMPKQKKRHFCSAQKKKLFYLTSKRTFLKYTLINACWNGGYLLARGAWDMLPLYRIGDLLCLINSCFVWYCEVYQLYLHHNFMTGNWV